MRRFKIDGTLWILLIVFVVIALTVVLLYFKLKPNHIASDIAAKNQIKMLVAVHDKEKLVFCDFLCIDPVTKQSALFDLPANTGVWNSQTSRYQFLSSLYDSKDISKLKESVSRFCDQEIAYQIEIDLTGLSNLIDLTGGIEVFLTDPISSLYKDEVRVLPGGSFKMQGYQTLYYLNYQFNNETSIEFLKRKQAIFRDLLLNSANSIEALKSPKVKKLFFSCFNSNLDSSSIFALLDLVKESDPKLMQFNQMRGELREVDGENYFLAQKSGALFKEQVRQILQALSDESYIMRELLSVNLEVLNGTNKSMLAARTTEYYQSYGYNVLATGNAPGDNYSKTIIYCRNNDYLKAATRIGALINCKNISVRESDPSLELKSWNGSDVTIILGADYDNYSCQN